jgi:hypothetical protein
LLCHMIFQFVEWAASCGTWNDWNWSGALLSLSMRMRSGCSEVAIETPKMHGLVVELNSKNQAFWCPSPSPPRRQPVPLTKLTSTRSQRLFHRAVKPRLTHPGRQWPTFARRVRLTRHSASQRLAAHRAATRRLATQRNPLPDRQPHRWRSYCFQTRRTRVARSRPLCDVTSTSCGQ